MIEIRQADAAGRGSDLPLALTAAGIASFTDW